MTRSRLELVDPQSLSVQSEGHAISRSSAAQKTLLPQNYEDLHRFAKMMSLANVMVGEVCRNNPGNSMAVAMQAMRWGMDPFAVSHECYVVKGNLSYSAKLVAAVIQSNAPIQGRLNYEYSGNVNDGSRRVRVYATFAGENEPKDVITPSLNEIKIQNSPLWKNDPDQQLAYYGARTWARRHAPDIIMGVVTRDEIEDNPGMRNVTPSERQARIQQRLGTADTPEQTDDDPDLTDEAETITDDEKVIDVSTEDTEPATDLFDTPNNARCILDSRMDGVPAHYQFMGWIAEIDTPSDVLAEYDAIKAHPDFAALTDDERTGIHDAVTKRMNELEAE